MALVVVDKLTAWFAEFDPQATSVPNLRVSMALLAVCIGDESIWNSNDNKEEELTFPWVLGEYKRILRDRIRPLDLYFEQQKTYTTGVF